MNYVMVGLNHHTADVAVREQAAVNEAQLGRTLHDLLSCPAIEEAVLISTCNRVEVYAATQEPQDARQQISKLLTSHGGAGIQNHLQSIENTAVVSHLFAVASSIDAMMVGENQVLGQVKQAYQAALDSGATGAYLNKLFHRAFFVAKRVKTETEIASGNVSIGSAGVQLARKIFGNLDGKTVVLLGAGEIGELVVRHLSCENRERTVIVNRTLAKAQELEREGLGLARNWNELKSVLLEADVLITSLGDSVEELSQAAMARVMSERNGSPLFIIDLGVPRNVPPEVNDLNDVYLYNIDDLKMVAEEGKKGRMQNLEKAKIIIDEEVRLFYEFHLDHQTVPMIANLNRKFEVLRRQELEKTLSRLPALDEQSRVAIDRLTQSIVSKILHDPILTLKSDRELKEPGLLQMVKKIFRLDEEE